MAGDDRGPQIEAVTIFMLVLATVAVTLRLLARYISARAGFWWDDWLSLAALVSPSPMAKPLKQILTICIAAFCMGKLCAFHILGAHWLRKTHQ